MSGEVDIVERLKEDASGQLIGQVCVLASRANLLAAAAEITLLRSARDGALREALKIAERERMREAANKARNPASELGGTATANVIAIHIRALLSPGEGEEKD